MSNINIKHLFLILAGINVLMSFANFNIISALGWICAMLYAYGLIESEEEVAKLKLKLRKKDVKHKK